MHTRLLLASLVGLATLPAQAHAAPQAEAGTERVGTWSAAVERAASDGVYLPVSLTPSVGPSTAQAAVYGGYNSAADAAALHSFAEARVYGPLALRVGVRLNEGGKEVGPSIGGRAQLLRQDRHAVNAAVAIFYKAEGFDEPEGEIETALSVGHRWSQFLLLGNVLYGQDPEGNERDGEVSLAGLFQISNQVNVGIDARGRFDLGSKREKLLATREPTFDLDAGPVLHWALGPVALNAHAGAALVRLIDEPTQAGVVALAGLGTAF